MPVDGIDGLLTDLDDTLTTGGLLTASAYAALWALARAGLRVVPVTGRPAGWAHMILRTWPVDAVVAESGGLTLWRDPANGRTRTLFHDDEARVRAGRVRLEACAARVLATLPGLAPASDNAYRQVDLALDWCEEVPRVDPATVDAAIAMFRAEGFSARASSVHVNAWAGDFDKAPAALRCLRECFPAQADPARWVFVGDAPNDASMFGAFPRSVAVANILPHLAALPVPPAFVTGAAGGAGFEELAARLLAGRR